MILKKNWKSNQLNLLVKFIILSIVNVVLVYIWRKVDRVKIVNKLNSDEIAWNRTEMSTYFHAAWRTAVNFSFALIFAVLRCSLRFIYFNHRHRRTTINSSLSHCDTAEQLKKSVSYRFSYFCIRYVLFLRFAFHCCYGFVAQ